MTDQHYRTPDELHKLASLAEGLGDSIRAATQANRETLWPTAVVQYTTDIERFRNPKYLPFDSDDRRFLVARHFGQIAAAEDVYHLHDQLLQSCRWERIADTEPWDGYADDLEETIQLDEDLAIDLIAAGKRLESHVDKEKPRASKDYLGITLDGAGLCFRGQHVQLSANEQIVMQLLLDARKGGIQRRNIVSSFSPLYQYSNPGNSADQIKRQLRTKLKRIGLSITSNKGVWVLVND